MLNDTRKKIYINAYITRLQRGETLEEIDKSYLDLKRLKKEDIDYIHKQLKEVRL